VGAQERRRHSGAGRGARNLLQSGRIKASSHSEAIANGVHCASTMICA
jgi:hypothetical protein